MPDSLTNAVSELTGLIREVATSLGDLKARQEEVEAKVAAAEEWKQKGFPIPKVEPGMTDDEVSKLIAPYQIAKQGLALMNGPRQHKLTPEVRDECAKYLLLVVQAGMNHSQTAREKIFELYGRNKNINVGDTGNAFPIPDIVMSEIVAFARESSVILQDAREWPMTSDKMSFPVESAGAVVTWGNTTEQGDPTITEVELDAEELSAYSAVRNDHMSDSRSDIVTWLLSTMSEACGQELDNQGFNGTGAGVNPFTGLLQHTSVQTSLLASGSTFASLTAPDLSAAIAKLDGMRKQGAKFYMNGAVLHYVRILADDQNRPIFVDSVGSEVPGRIYGYPYKEVIKMPSTTAVSTKYILFGNMKYFFVGRRQDSNSLMVDPYGLFTTNRTRFKIYQRWALVTALPAAFVGIKTNS